MTIKLIGIFLVSFWLMKVSNGLYEEFCVEEQVYTPYVKLYGYKPGSTSHTLNAEGMRPWGSQLNKGDTGPSEIPRYVGGHMDLFVCLNGPAWLYFEWKKEKRAGSVLDDAEFQIYEHKCQLFNGMPGPGNITTRKMLVAILLLGQGSDYRKPHLQLFTAPKFNSETKNYDNVTSLMIIGSEPCTITKGKGTSLTEIHIKPKDTDNMYCKISYNNLTFLQPTDSDKQKIETDRIQGLLKNDKALRLGKCSGAKSAAMETYMKMRKFSKEDLKGIIKSKVHLNITDFSKNFEDFKTLHQADLADLKSVDIKELNDSVATHTTAHATAPEDQKLDKLKELDAEVKKLNEGQFELKAYQINTEVIKIFGDDGNRLAEQWEAIKNGGCGDTDTDPTSGLCTAVIDYQTALNQLKVEEDEEKKLEKQLKQSMYPTKKQIDDLRKAKKKTTDTKSDLKDKIVALNKENEILEDAVSRLNYDVAKGESLLKALKFALTNFKDVKVKPEKKYVETEYHTLQEIVVPLKIPADGGGRHARATGLTRESENNYNNQLPADIVEKRKAFLRNRFKRAMDRIAGIYSSPESKVPSQNIRRVRQDSPVVHPPEPCDKFKEPAGNDWYFGSPDINH